MKITAIRTVPYWYNLDRPIGDVNLPEGVTVGADLAVFIDTDEGLTGTTIGALDAEDPIRRLEGVLRGRDPRSVRGIWNHLFALSFKTGNSGPAKSALSALDCALWDLRAKAHGVPLWKELGGEGRGIRAYASGLDAPLTDEQLVVFYSRMAAMGVSAGKLKVGAGPEDDIRRLSLMKHALSPDGRHVDVMVDANEYWSPKQAVQRICALEQFFELTWVEEPVRRWDRVGLRRVSDAVRAPIATGENLDDVHDYVPLVVAGAVDLVQVSHFASGISGALQVAQLADAFDLPVSLMNCPGRFMAHLAAALPNHTMMEVLDVGRDAVLACQLAIADGHIVLNDNPGSGITFDEAKLEAHRLTGSRKPSVLADVYRRSDHAGLVGRATARQLGRSKPKEF